MGKDKIKRLTHDGNPKKSHKDNKENQSLSRRINKEKNAVKKNTARELAIKSHLPLISTEELIC